MLGQILGDYEIQQEIGRGPSATVYTARQHPVERYVAVKVFEPQTRDVAQGLKDLYARLIELDHTHMLPLYDSSRWQDRYFWVMRYMPAGSLKTRLGKQRLTLEEIDRVLPQVASALDYAHGHNIVHGDLKLTDVLIDHTGQAFVTDFGVAEALGRSASTFRAPEIWRGSAPDARTDVYGLGALLYELLTLRSPLEPPAAGEERANRRLLPPAPSTVSKAPAALDAVILRALAVDPDQRYQTPGDLLDAYGQARLGKKGAAPVAAATAAVAAAAATSSASRVRRISTRRSEPEKKNRWRVAGLIGGGLIGLLLIALLALWLGRTPAATLSPIGTATSAVTALPGAATITATRVPATAASPAATITPRATTTVALTVQPTATTSPAVTSTRTPTGAPTNTPTRAPTRFVPTATPAISIAPFTLTFPRSEGRDNLSLTFRTAIVPVDAGIIGTLSMAVPDVEERVLDRSWAQVGSGDQVLRVAVAINCAGADGPITSRQIILTLRAPDGKVLLTQPVDYVKRWCE